jgi:hypothetical protein
VRTLQELWPLPRNQEPGLVGDVRARAYRTTYVNSDFSRTTLTKSGSCQHPRAPFVRLQLRAAVCRRLRKPWVKGSVVLPPTDKDQPVRALERHGIRGISPNPPLADMGSFTLPDTYLSSPHSRRLNNKHHRTPVLAGHAPRVCDHFSPNTFGPTHSVPFTNVSRPGVRGSSAWQVVGVTLEK